jgi:hypothetical protein
MRVFGEEFRFEPVRVFALLLRFVTVLALAVWFGGFTFYSTAVIATSQEVLHSQLRAGLITQQVTNWLNWISLPALAICAGNLIVQRKDPRRFWVWTLGAALAGMVVLQISLFPAHWVLDSRIVGHEVADDGGFFRLHRIYLMLATGQWCATLVYIFATLVLWTERANSRRGDESRVGGGMRDRDAASAA